MLQGTDPAARGSAFVNATRSASGLRRHMPVNSLTVLFAAVRGRDEAG